MKCAPYVNVDYYSLLHFDSFDFKTLTGRIASRAFEMFTIVILICIHVGMRIHCHILNLFYTLYYYK